MVADTSTSNLDIPIYTNHVFGYYIIMDDFDQVDWVYDRVMEHIGPHRKYSKHICLRCPICGDSQKDKRKMRGHYYIDTCSYHCFNEECKADGFGLIAQLSGEDRDTILHEYFKDKYSGNLKKRKKAESTKAIDKVQIIEPLDSWTYDIPDKVMRYLTKRLVFEAPYFDKEYRFMWDREMKRLVIPWYNSSGQMIYYQYRQFKKGHLKYVFPKETVKPVGNLDMVDLSFPYIFPVEGYFDSIFMLNGVCVGGATITQTQREILKERYPHHTLVQCYDYDTAGMKSMIRNAKKFPRDKFLLWAKDMNQGEDVNDYAMRVGLQNTYTDPKRLEQLITYGAMVKLDIDRMYK